MHIKRPLLRLRSLAADERLVPRCRNRGKFNNTMSALDDLFKLLDIGDDLPPEDKRAIPKESELDVPAAASESIRAGSASRPGRHQGAVGG